MKVNRDRGMILVGTAVVAFAIAAVALALIGGAEPMGSVPTPLVADVSNAVGTQAPGGADTTADPMAQTQDDDGSGTSATGTHDDATSGSDAGDSGAGSTDDSGDGDNDTDTDGTTAGATTDVLILWWNDTVDTAVKIARISIAGSTWAPDATIPSQDGTLVEVPVGQDLLLVIEPDGPDGAHIEVPIHIDAGMMPDTERDAISVEISDTSVRILGNPVENIDVTFDRF